MIGNTGGKDLVSSLSNVHSIVAMCVLTFIGVCNGTFLGYVFWHLDNIGKNLLSVRKGLAFKIEPYYLHSCRRRCQPASHLPHKVKTQYLQIDTSIWCQISSSIRFHTKRLYVHNVWYSRYSLQLWKRIDRLLITSGIFQSNRKYSACDLKCRYCVFTLWNMINAC